VARGEAEPTKYWLSTLPETVSFQQLVDLPSCAGVSSADYQELKQEVGLGHYEGRGWRGFHHHATLCIATYGFLIAEQATIPPSGPRSAASFQAPHLPDDYRPRGSASRPERHIPNSIATMRVATNLGDHQNLAAMSLLWGHSRSKGTKKTHDAVRLARSADRR